MSINMNTITNTNKINALLSFARLMSIDILLLQEVSSSDLALDGYNVFTNVDHHLRGTAIALKPHIQTLSTERSLDGRLITVKLPGDVLICNIYAPSGTQNRNYRENFFNETIAYYIRNAPDNIILGGDFNAVISAKDATGTNSHSPALQRSIKNLHLTDTWELLYRDRVEYTFIRPNASSRLDRIYISEKLKPHLRTASVHVTSFTDHKAYLIRLCLPNQGKDIGRGYWSIRPHILTESNLEEFALKWVHWVRQRRNYKNWMEWWIQFAKPKVKSFYRWKSGDAFRLHNAHHEALYYQLRLAYNDYATDSSAIQRVNAIKGKMLLLQRRFSQNFAKINDRFIAGERLSTLQIGDKLKRKKRSFINTITTDDNVILNGTAEVEQHIYDFYKNLYTSSPTTPTNYQHENPIPTTNSTNMAIMNDFSATEIFEAINGSATGKSAGLDGMPVEFYKKSFNIIHREFAAILNEALRGNIPKNFVDGVIVLCPKKNGSSTIKNYRPISLLNCDYKIFSRILKLRLEKILNNHQILNSAQKCSNKGRNIFEALLSTKDKIMQIKNKRKCGRLISFDLQNAFDRVERPFLFAIMKSMGINNSLVTLLEKIMDNSHSKILINGHLSREFKIERSVRQGDPIAMHLFVIYLHPLLEKLIGVCDGELDLVIAYADDVTIITCDLEKIEEVRVIFEDYGLVSGSKLNLTKTTSIDIGDTAQIARRNQNTHSWLKVDRTVKILGIEFQNNQRAMVSENWKKIILGMTRLLNLYRGRILSVRQKVIICNTFISSKIWFSSSVLNITNENIAKITSQLRFFIWGSYHPRVAIAQLALPICRGGLNLHIPAIKCKALLINRHLSTTHSTPFTAAFLNNPANIEQIPSYCPCIKLICDEMIQLPNNLLQNLSSKAICEQIIQNMPDPPFAEDENINWKRIWKNISNKYLISEEKSLYYLLVHRKIPCREIMHRIGRTDSPLCVNCNTGVNETIIHKFSMCNAIRPIWIRILALMQARAGTNRLNFDTLSQPVLSFVSRNNRFSLMKMFINYIKVILETPIENIVSSNIESYISLIL